MSTAPDRTAVAVVAYYFARFDKIALQHLGFDTWKAAYDEVGGKLGVKNSYLKNRRDGFDPLFSWRRGWWQRPLSASEGHINSLLTDLDEEAVRTLVLRLLDNANAPETRLLHNVITVEAGTISGVVANNQRAVTGAAAEALFIEMHSAGQSGFTGTLLDHRLNGNGYDFLIRSQNQPDQFIEVKGAAGDSSGISFTSKEWTKAQQLGNNYWLVVISNVHNEPVLRYLNNPAASLQPRQQFHTVIQTSWQVPASQMIDVPSVVFAV